MRILQPAWPTPPGVRARFTTRAGGVSRGNFSSFNLATHVGDDPVAVAANRRTLHRVAGLPAEPVWLNQVHSGRVVVLDGPCDTPDADAAVTTVSELVCVVMVADCVPILLADASGEVVAAVHAGWRGLAAGVVENAVRAMRDEIAPGRELLAWIGPAIGRAAYVVGDELRDRFVDVDALDARFFETDGVNWWADLFGLTRRRLRKEGVERIHGSRCCTAGDAERFFSYRRDGETGRMAALIWRHKPD